MPSRKAFSIIELMVVVAIVALLLAILLPAIGKARDQAHVTRSQSNLRQLAVAHTAYAAAHNDQQWSNIPHDLAQFGDSLHGAMLGLAATGRLEGSDQWSCQGGCAWRTTLGHAKGGHSLLHAIKLNAAAPPIDLDGFYRRWGSFRIVNVRTFNVYMSGRFYDATFYAPKDRAVIDAIADCWDAPGEYCTRNISPTHAFLYNDRTNVLAYSSYILSAAAMYSPDVFSMGPTFTLGDVWNLPSAFRSPTFSQARYPDLKTHMLEHHWLQRPARACIAGAFGTNRSNSGDCEPPRFNGGLESTPVTLFYDGSIRMLSQREVLDADSQAKAASGSNTGLWHTGTPLAATGEHYYHQWAYTPPGTATYRPSSYHVLTRNGILGRDTFSQ